MVTISTEIGYAHLKPTNATGKRVRGAALYTFQTPVQAIRHGFLRLPDYLDSPETGAITRPGED